MENDKCQMTMRSSILPINFSQHDIQRSDDRHDIRHHLTFSHHRQRRKDSQNSDHGNGRDSVLVHHPIFM